MWQSLSQRTIGFSLRIKLLQIFTLRRNSDEAVHQARHQQNANSHFCSDYSEKEWPLKMALAIVSDNRTEDHGFESPHGGRFVVGLAPVNKVEIY
jgi:hypothetical protein